MILCAHAPQRAHRPARLILIGLGVLILCSCRGAGTGNLLGPTAKDQADALASAPPARSAPPSPALPSAQVAKRPPGNWQRSLSDAQTSHQGNEIAQVAHVAADNSAAARKEVVAEVTSLDDCPPGYAGSPYWGPRGLPGEHGVYDPALGPWQPPGLQGPWPYDEYIFDGGDREITADVLPDWTVRGLEQEDTVAHYDQLDGRTVVVPSNRIPIYAPRFAAVRKVVSVEQAHQREKMAGVDAPTGPRRADELLVATTVIQPVQPDTRLSTKTPVDFRERNLGVEVGVGKHLGAFHNGFMPYEDFLFVRQGIFEQSEKVRLAESIEAALTWTGKQAAQVLVDGRPVATATGDVMPNEAVRYESSPRPKLRIIKLASKLVALPGDIIDFTLRFDNVGNETVGNVTVLDNLTTRLEFVPGSEQCSLPAEFKPVLNEGETHILRWEITDPLERAHGGIIRFKCKVR